MKTNMNKMKSKQIKFKRSILAIDCYHTEMNLPQSLFRYLHHPDEGPFATQFGSNQKMNIN